MQTENEPLPAEAPERTGLALPPPAIRPEEIRLFYHPPGQLRMQVGEERSYPIVRIYRAAPLSRPTEYLVFVDGKGNEICTIERLADLDPANRRIVEHELAHRYLTARIERILSLRVEGAVSYWLVDTDRGRRDFVVQGTQENCHWLTDDHLLLVDVDGNRFEIASLAGLDERSRALLAPIE